MHGWLAISFLLLTGLWLRALVSDLRDGKSLWLAVAGSFASVCGFSLTLLYPVL
jgi:hypothetical protein